MNVERTYRRTRMLQSRVQFSSTAALPPTVFLADCIINIVESEFSIGTASKSEMPLTPSTTASPSMTNCRCAGTFLVGVKARASASAFSPLFDPTS